MNKLENIIERFLLEAREILNDSQSTTSQRIIAVKIIAQHGSEK